jgi:ribosomal protein L35AE/L33A
VQNEISRGFQTSPTETILFVSIVGALILAFVVYQLRMNRGSKSPQRKKSGKSASAGGTTADESPAPGRTGNRKRDDIELSRGQHQTLERLAWFLKDPKQKDRLLHDERLLERVARQAVREGIVERADASGLLRKLGIDSRGLTTTTGSSSDLPIGTEVSFSDEEARVASGKVVSGHRGELRVQIEKNPGSVKTGSRVEVLAESKDGLYRFDSLITGRDGKDFLLQHTNRMQHVQRRQYRRRKVDIPVDVRLPGIDERTLSTRTHDVSVGGAAIRNPRKRLSTGSRVECVFETDRPTPVSVQGTVVRTSRRSKIAHVSFGPIDEKTKHRVFRLVIRAVAR